MGKPSFSSALRFIVAVQDFLCLVSALGWLFVVKGPRLFAVLIFVNWLPADIEGVLGVNENLKTV
jgi:heme oxygenase